MGKIDTRIDAYISKSQHFAKPVLNHFRNLVHTVCPNVEETIKWGFPHFDYKGMFCNMAAFKQHCAFGFWKTSLMKDAQEMMGKNEHSMPLASLIKKNILNGLLRRKLRTPGTNELRKQ